MLDNLRFWFVYALIVVAILVVGWRQPLRYRFMSPEEIFAIEHPAATPNPEAIAAARATPWMFDPRRKTMLDREPYNQNGGGGSGSGSGSGMSSSRSR